MRIYIAAPFVPAPKLLAREFIITTPINKHAALFTGWCPNIDQSILEFLVPRNPTPTILVVSTAQRCCAHLHELTAIAKTDPHRPGTFTLCRCHNLK